jgi:hypothetical protein
MAKSKGMFTGSVVSTSHQVESQDQVDTAYATGRYAKAHGLTGAEAADLLQMLGVDTEPVVADALSRHGFTTTETVALG